TMANRDLYADLGVPQYANTTQIKSAFRTLAKQSHPDKTGNDDSTAFRYAREAYETLSDATARAEYDRDYRHKRMQYTYFDGPSSTRTAAYDAEQTASEAPHESTAEKLRRSPPPTKPTQDPYEPDTIFLLSNRFAAWQKRHDAYCAEHPWYKPPGTSTPAPASSSSSMSVAHGLIVKMSSHPATTQSCTLRTPEWRVQKSGTDICVFCLNMLVRGGSRCPGCEVLACGPCLRTIIAKERQGSFGGSGSKARYAAAGG
ncbi:DnaJ domain-containing protein, partial [Ampelomyces quisqualis]